MPFEPLQIGRWLIEVDREATHAAYLNELPISACGCDDCQNYFAACSAKLAHSSAVMSLFRTLGISPEKEAEVYTLYTNPEKTHASYGGFYHLVGRMISTTNGPNYVQIDDHFEVAITEQNDLLSSGFPRPALQMEFTCSIPWVLEEKRAALDPLPVVASL
ncbi:hypothetical protein [Ktedonospora formicarum]|uniref:Uncharacterized protein n=1 Tax=Ktedonospora formicarum TaxID=2778364 RepID=A0A8J3IBF1_9CHLR|nr:hypothetical protein [Ktedonospora formicarum]GHO50896.1 hypothetical protein KSX_90590 [Ktedonospora formicarum]